MTFFWTLGGKRLYTIVPNHQWKMYFLDRPFQRGIERPKQRSYEKVMPSKN
jgi:hypothetical protein